MTATTRAAVLACVGADPGVTPADVYARIGLSRDAIKKCLQRAAGGGELGTDGRGHYWAGRHLSRPSLPGQGHRAPGGHAPG